MTQRFILDENVVIFAQKGRGKEGEREITSARLFSEKTTAVKNDMFSKS